MLQAYSLKNRIRFPESLPNISENVLWKTFELWLFLLNTIFFFMSTSSAKVDSRPRLDKLFLEVLENKLIYSDYNVNIERDTSKMLPKIRCSIIEFVQQLWSFTQN